VLATGDLGAVDITLTIIVKRLGGNTADFMFSLNNQGETPWDPPRLVADVFCIVDNTSEYAKLTPYSRSIPCADAYA